MFTVYSVRKNGEECVFAEAEGMRAYAKSQNYRWHVRITFFRFNGSVIETWDFIMPHRQAAMNKLHCALRCVEYAINHMEGLAS
jgi:hypothetical protein